MLLPLKLCFIQIKRNKKDPPLKKQTNPELKKQNRTNKQKNINEMQWGTND